MVIGMVWTEDRGQRTEDRGQRTGDGGRGTAGFFVFQWFEVVAKPLRYESNLHLSEKTAPP
jgi:hypothetical protein